ncbi:MAG: MarR family EPS-associated transcriptional regulator [Candidatus Omnitrophota bacterium]
MFESEEAYHLIREIEKNPQATQRYLAEKMTVSLGKINFLINALVDKGVIKIQNFKNSKRKLAYMYLLTPYGIKTKIRLAREFLTWKTQQYARLKLEIENFKKEIKV